MNKHVLLFSLIIILAGCDTPFRIEMSTKTLREENGFSVISEQHTYRRETGGVVEYGSYSFKVSGRAIHNEDVSKLLFPDSVTGCHSSFYSIDDIRLLSDNSVLALMSKSQSYCKLGRRFVAKIYVDAKSKRIVTQRLPLIVSGEEVSASDHAGLFHHLTSEGFSYGYQNHLARLNVLAQPIGIVGVTTQTGESFLFDQQSGRMIDLGKGSVISFEDKHAVALLHTTDRKMNTNTFRAVRVADGKTLDSLSYRSDCYRPAGESARQIAVGNYAMLARNEVVNRQIEAMAKQHVDVSAVQTARNDLAYSPDIEHLIDHFEKAEAVQFNVDRLSGIALTASNWAVQEIQEKETVLNWDDKYQKLTATISQNLRRIKGCSK